MPKAEKNQQRPMPANRIATQARICAQKIVETLGTSLILHQPADRALRQVFAENHQLGARDRRIISETAFSVLRWWGWLQKLAPEAFREAWQNGAPEPPPVHGSDWYGLLAASWVLENRLDFPPSVMFWLREAKLYPELFEGLPDHLGIPERRRFLRPFFQQEKMPSLLPEELLPAWLPEALAPEEKVDYAKLLEWLQRRPPVWLRAQPHGRCEVSQIQREIEHESEGAVRILRHERMEEAMAVRHASANLRALRPFQNGEFEIQDLASQCVALVCAPKAGEQWWDACAGGGGKALHLAWLMQNRGTVLATDLRASKLEELKLRARRDGFNNIRMRVWEGHVEAQYRNRFDGVLVDTPCSCSGTWRRAPDGRWNTTPIQLEKFTALQKQLLTAAADAVRPGGILVYSTCSMLRCENQQVVEEFLDAHRDFILEPCRDPMTGKETDGMCQHWPWEGDCDAMFTARLRRRKTAP